MVAGPHVPKPRSSAMLWKCSEPDARPASSRRPRPRYASDAGVVQPTIPLDRLPPRWRLATGRRSPAGSTTEAPSEGLISKRHQLVESRTPGLARAIDGGFLGANCSPVAIEGAGLRRKNDGAGETNPLGSRSPSRAIPEVTGGGGPLRSPPPLVRMTREYVAGVRTAANGCPKVRTSARCADMTWVRTSVTAGHERRTRSQSIASRENEATLEPDTRRRSDRRGQLLERPAAV
jgi:hypothetical protein